MIQRKQPFCGKQLLRMIPIVGAAWGLISSAAYAEDESAPPAPLRVLFIGNSYTHAENLPYVIASLSENGAVPLIVRKTTVGGATLADHLQGNRSLESLRMLEEGEYDAVILQDQSLRPVQSPEETIADITTLCEIIRKRGATPYLYVTWARQKLPQMQDDLNRTYFEAARLNDAVVIPVGPAWALARELRPDAPLFAPDGSHPSRMGTYLTACVFYAVLTGESPMGLTRHPCVIDQSGQTIELLRLDSFDAEFCQRVAEQTVQKYRSVQTDVPGAR